MKQIITIFLLAVVTLTFAEDKPDFLGIIEQFDITENIIAYKKQERPAKGKSGRKGEGKSGRKSMSSEAPQKPLKEEKFSSDNYDIVHIKSGTLGNTDVWIVNIKSKVEDSHLPLKTAYIDLDRDMVLKMEEFTIDKTLVRTIYRRSL